MNPDSMEIDTEAVAEQVVTLYGKLEIWFQAFLDQALSESALWQAGVVVLAAILGWGIARFPRKRLLALAEERRKHDAVARIFQSLASVSWPFLSLILVAVAMGGFVAGGLPSDGLRIVASLLMAWIIIRLLTTNMKRSFLSRTIALFAWTVAALYILRWLGPAISALDAMRFPVGATSISAWRILTSLVIAGLALWAGRMAGVAVQSRLRTTTRLNPSMAGLLGQTTNIVFMLIAIVFALQTLGVNLAALTIFSGALGVGIGFGLQSIFSNFISGIIILFEKSVKVGDFIELQSGVTGLVNEINIRSTLVTTNDNVDILVPNEEFIKAQVINWTLRDTRRRTHIKFGVAYGSDKNLVRKAGMEAAAEVQWTLENMGPRMPQVWLTGFGDSSLDFELVVWLTEEAVKKPAKVSADYNWAIHSALERHGIEIPFPQQDLHFRGSDVLRVQITPEGTAEAEAEAKEEGQAAEAKAKAERTAATEKAPEE